MVGEPFADLLQVCHDPAATLLPNSSGFEDHLRDSLKKLFDTATALEPAGVKPLGPLSELQVQEAFDAETIWQELRLRDGPLLRWARGTTGVLHHLHGAYKLSSGFLIVPFN